MISKAKRKLLKSLQSKKNRQKHQSFLVQGEKSVLELLQSGFTTTILLATGQFIRTYGPFDEKIEVVEVTSAELKQSGTLETNENALAVAGIPTVEEPALKPGEVGLMLDTINDPGNLGTIVRTADWFGITKIVASPQTTDFFNPKVINATMGSFSRISVYYSDLEAYMRRNPGYGYWGAVMKGTSIYKCDLNPPGFLVMGSESHGIQSGILKHVQQQISIPGFGKAESLNVAIATGIILSHLIGK